MKRRTAKLRLLREAIDRLDEIACVLREALGPGAALYLAGGAAEGRLTVLSDIDIIIVLDREPSFEEAVSIRERIMEALEAAGIPPYLPLDLHIVGPERLKRYRVVRMLECRAKQASA